MNYSMVLYILGYILQFESAFLMLPALVSLIYQEEAGIPFVITAAICLVLGIVFTHKKPSSSTVYTREGFVTVALSWIVMSIFGAIPFVWNGDIPYYVDALFETVSGLPRPVQVFSPMSSPCRMPAFSGAVSATGSAAWVCSSLLCRSCL